MDAAIVYADINLPEGSLSRRNVGSVQQPEHRLCPRWHWIVLQVGWAGNIILVAAVIALGVCVMNKNSQHPEQGAMLFSHNAHKYSHDGRNKTLEDFKSILKQKLCEAATASTENGSCHLCPVTWLLHRHKCYWFSKSIQNWMQSKGDCVAKKSQLLVIHDEEEKEFLQKNIVEKVWIGLHVTPQEKKWIWINDSPLNRTLFPGMQPEMDSCGALAKKSGICSDLCSADLQWICQKESVLI